MRGLDEVVERLAVQQHGAFTRDQVLAAGGSPSACDRRLRSRAWVRSAEAGVYLLRAQPDTWRQRLMACVLAGPSGTLASHRAAAVLHGVHERSPVEVTVPIGTYHRLVAGMPSRPPSGRG